MEPEKSSHLLSLENDYARDCETALNGGCSKPGEDSYRLWCKSRMGHFQVLVPLFQSESKCETILTKMTLICMKMKLHAELIFV